MRLFLCSLVAMSLSAGVVGQANADYIFTTIDAPGSIGGTFPSAINDAGQIVGTYLLTGDNSNAFLLSEGTYTILNAPGAAATTANGINNSGQIVGEYQLGRTIHGFLLSRGTYTTIEVPGSSSTRLEAINDAGQIIGSYKAGSIANFLLSGSNYTDIDVPGSLFTSALGINASGQIVGYYGDAPGQLSHVGFLLSGGNYTSLLAPGADFTELYGINASGQIVGVGDDGFLLANSIYTPLVVPGAVNTTPAAINDAGQIVGYYVDTSNARHGFLATPTTSLVVSVPAGIGAGSPFEITVSAVDNTSGQVATGYTGTVTFSTSDPYPGVLPADYTFTPDDQGTHTFAGVTLFTAGTQTLSVQDTSDSSIMGSATAAVVAAPADHLLITTPPTVSSDTAFDVTLAALDAFGNVAMSYAGTVTWTSSDIAPGVILPVDYAFRPTDNGLVTFPTGVTLITPGYQTLSATDTASPITGTLRVNVQ
jgi:uncharacterized membrane protein